MKKRLSVLLALAMVAASLSACGGQQAAPAPAPAQTEAPAAETAAPEEGVKTFKVGICNYVDDASLNQIVDNIKAQLEAVGATVEIK